MARLRLFRIGGTMAYKLEKPYTDKQKADFIVKYNHNTGLKIVESNTALCALEAWEEVNENGDILDNTEIWQQEQQEKEVARIKSLKLTKRVFALALQQMGITYTQLKTLISTSEQAQLEWDLCVELERANPLLDTMAAQMGISSEQLDYIFRKGNGEDITPPASEIEVTTNESEEL